MLGRPLYWAKHLHRQMTKLCFGQLQTTNHHTASKPVDKKNDFRELVRQTADLKGGLLQVQFSQAGFLSSLKNNFFIPDCKLAGTPAKSTPDIREDLNSQQPLRTPQAPNPKPQKPQLETARARQQLRETSATASHESPDYRNLEFFIPSLHTLSPSRLRVSCCRICRMWGGSVSVLRGGLD